MKRKDLYLSISILLAGTILLGLPVAGHDANGQGWPHYRGPERSGLSPERGIPTDWPGQGPAEIWKREIGSGFSGIVFVKNRLFTMFAGTEGDKALEFAAALEVETGKEIWRTPIGELFKDEFGDGPRSTPAVNSDKVFCLSSRGQLLALSMKDGKKIWEVDFTKLFGSQIPRWGFSTSPVVLGNLVIVESGGGKGKAFAGLDKETGAVVWKSQDGGATYSSPIVANLGGKTQIIFANGTHLYSLDNQGTLLWSYQSGVPNPIAMPVFVSPDKFFVSSVSKTGGVMIQVTGQGNKPVVKEIWRSKNLRNNWSSSCYYNGYLYGFDNATLKCIAVDSGEIRWSKRGYGKGSLILADGKLFVLSDRGKLILAMASPDGYEEKASFQALNGKSWTEPTLINGRLYLRNLKQIACYRLK